VILLGILKEHCGTSTTYYKKTGTEVNTISPIVKSIFENTVSTYLKLHVIRVFNKMLKKQVGMMAGLDEPITITKLTGWKREVLPIKGINDLQADQ